MGMVYSNYKMDTMYHFYCYYQDNAGESVIIPILASDEDHAWDIFEAMGYNSGKYFVDQVIKVQWL